MKIYGRESYDNLMCLGRQSLMAEEDAAPCTMHVGDLEEASEFWF